MTVTKYLTTRDVRREVTNAATGQTVTRGPWALKTKAWPAYMYLTIACLSVVLDGLVLLAYLKDIRTANRLSTAATVFAWAIILAHVAVWIVGVVLYRTEKDKNGVGNDLWGWSCSAAAEKIQEAFAEEVNFGRYCDIQVSSKM